MSNTTKLRSLILDIETSPHVMLAWKVWDASAAKLLEASYIISFAAKWHHQNKVTYMDILTHDKLLMLIVLHDMINSADMVITHNGDKFDMKMIVGEFMFHQLEPLSEYRSIDTLKLSKKYTRLPYHNLGYLCDYFNKTHKKLEHGQGIELWHDFLKGIRRAKRTMKKYNIHDVLCLEELYFGTFAGWDRATNNWITRQLKKRSRQ